MGVQLVRVRRLCTTCVLCPEARPGAFDPLELAVLSCLVGAWNPFWVLWKNSTALNSSSHSSLFVCLFVFSFKFYFRGVNEAVSYKPLNQYCVCLAAVCLTYEKQLWILVKT